MTDAEKSAADPLPLRQAARVILLDPDDRVLLMRYDQGPPNGRHWATPGGGVGEGEGFRAAALRELAEETGWRDIVLLGEVLRRGLEMDYAGQLVRQHERLYLARTGQARREIHGVAAMHAADGIAAWRWWTLAELQVQPGWLGSVDFEDRLGEQPAEFLSPGQPRGRRQRARVRCPALTGVSIHVTTVSARPATTVGQVSGSGTGMASAGSLAAAIEAGLDGAGASSLTSGVQRLMAAYRSGGVPAAPVVASGKDAAAYAAYRMPATAAATALALQETLLSLSGWTPATLLDFGTGTGSVAWAVADRLPSIRAMTLLERSADAIALGRAIARTSASPVLHAATWRAWRVPDDAACAWDDLPSSDLATASYLLGELTTPEQATLVTLAARAAPVVVLVEPGTPAGHRRILTARTQLIGTGYVIAAPCPHQRRCPLEAEGDWCHFGARLPRSALHRQVKGAELAYEDEKFSYVAAVRPTLLASASPGQNSGYGRIIRRPQQRQGLVMLDLCAPDGSVRRELVSKSQGAAYRQARKSSWGQRWADPEQN